MLSPTAYAIRPATPEDRAALARLAALDSRPPLHGPALVAESGGVPVAALSLADGRMIADPFEPTRSAGAHLRTRAEALAAHDRTPSLAERLRGAVVVVRRPRPA